MKEFHDRKGTTSHLYEAGQMVRMSLRNVALRHPSLRHKLVPRYIGPIKVLETVGRNAVRLEMPASLDKIHPTVSVSLLKPFMVRAGLPAPPVNIDGELEWEVEAIIGHNVVQSRSKKVPTLVEFQVKWKGDFDTSWHEFVDFEHSIASVEAYLSTCSKSARQRIYKGLKPDELLRLSMGLQREAKASGK
jgi:hypothetical protein